MRPHYQQPVCSQVDGIIRISVIVKWCVLGNGGKDWMSDCEW